LPTYGPSPAATAAWCCPSFSQSMHVLAAATCDF
jgi:hypothetical protein